MVENIPDCNITQEENKEVIKYDKSKKYYDWSDKTLWTYNDKDIIEGEKLTISTFSNNNKINVEIALEVHGMCGITITFKEKNTKQYKMKTGILSRVKIKKERTRNYENTRSHKCDGKHEEKGFW